jgi:hypothetical protein
MEKGAVKVVVFNGEDFCYWKNQTHNYPFKDDSVWGMKITTLEQPADFATLDTKKLFSKLKSHELSRKGRLNHDASLTSTAFVTSTHVGDHVANPTNTTDSTALQFALSSLCALLMSSTRASLTMRSPCW